MRSLKILWIIICYVILSSSARADEQIPSYLDKYPTAEAIIPLSKVNLEQMRSFERSGAICTKIVDGFDTFLSTLGNNSQSMNAAFRLLVQMNLSCSFTTTQLGERALKLRQHNAALVWNIFDDELIKWLVPSKAFDLDALTPPTFIGLSEWLRQGAVAADANLNCNATAFNVEQIPEASCFGYWFAWRIKPLIPLEIWQQVAVANHPVFTKWLQDTMATMPVAVFSWFEKLAMTNAQHAQAAFDWALAHLQMANLEWLESQAPFLNAIINQPIYSPTMPCEQWLKVGGGLLKRFRKTTPQSLWANVVRISTNFCADKAKLVQTLESAIPTDSYSIGLENLGDLSLGNVQVQSFARDLDLREGLNLKFAYGSVFDAEDLVLDTTSADKFIVDSILFDRLRRADSTPWVRLNEDIEDEVSNEQVVRVALSAAAITEPVLFSGLFESLYLDAYDRTMLQGSSISNIRLMVTELARELPQARDLAYAVHNALNRSLVETARGLLAQLSVADREKFGAKINEIVTALENYFDPQMTPCAEIAKYLEVQPLGDDFSSRVKNFCDAPVENIFTNANSLLDAVLIFKNGLIEEFKKNGVLAFESPAAKNYVHSLRIRKLAHKYIMTFVSSATDNDHHASAIAFYDYIARYFNIKLDTTRSAVEVMEQVQNQLQTILYPRSILARWFVLLQAKRIVPNAEYIPSLYTRLYALRFINEALLRDQGLFLFSKFDDKNVHARVLTQGTTYGQLTFVPKSQLETHPYRLSEIVVTDAIPLNLGTTAALVTTVWQGIGSHIDLRTRERGTPNAFKADALESWKDEFGKWVKLEFSRSGIRLTAVSQQEALAHVKKPTPLIVPVPEWGVMAPQNLDEPQPTTRVGSKAHGFSNLRRLFKDKGYTPPGIAIPFGAYRWFVTEFGLQKDIDNLLATYKQLQPTALEQQLSDLEEKFEKAAKNETFVQSKWMTEMLLPRLKQLTTETVNEGMTDGWDLQTQCFRFRSSTNSEDLLGFTGAGLYESQGGCLNPEKPKKSVARALAKAWGSLWTYRAFSERDYYGIDHRNVGMALLVHRNWADEDVNGVMITRSKMDSVYFVTAGTDEDSATNPTGTVQSTELQFTLRNQKTTIANETKGAVSLSEDERNELAVAGEQVWLDALNDYKGFSGLPGLRMDLEFKFQVTPSGSRRLFIKQARPFVGE